jgi:hypothetical protein
MLSSRLTANRDPRERRIPACPERALLRRKWQFVSGVNQVKVMVPSGLSGPQPVTVQTGSGALQAGVTVAVQ